MLTLNQVSNFSLVSNNETLSNLKCAAQMFMMLFLLLFKVLYTPWKDKVYVFAIKVDAFDTFKTCPSIWFLTLSIRRNSAVKLHYTPPLLGQIQQRWSLCRKCSSVCFGVSHLYMCCRMCDRL